MNCAAFENLIALNVTGDLPAREAAEVQAHLNECDSCRALAEELSSDLQWLQSAHREPADHAALHQVRVGVMRQLEAERSRWDRPFGGLTAPGWRWQWVAVTAAVAFVVAGIAWWVYPSAEPGTAVVADASGTNSRQPADSLQSLARQIDAPAATLRPNAGVAGPSRTDVPEPPSERRVRQESLPGMPAVAREALRRPRTQSGPTNRLAHDEPPAGALAAESGERREERAEQPQAEIVLVSGEEPEGPVESVRVRMPTSNSGIVVYWLMDEKDKGD